MHRWRSACAYIDKRHVESGSLWDVERKLDMWAGDHCIKIISTTIGSSSQAVRDALKSMRHHGNAEVLLVPHLADLDGMTIRSVTDTCTLIDASTGDNFAKTEPIPPRRESA